MALRDRLKRMWNAFRYDEQTTPYAAYQMGPSTSGRPDRKRLRFANERSIISSIYTRLSIDLAAIDIRHIELDDQGRYVKDADSGLNHCLMFEPNLDQGPRSFKQDIALTLFDKGSAAIVPVDTINDPTIDGTFDIQTLRVGEICYWYPRHVRVSLYNIDRGLREEITLEKKFAAVVENPLYSVMNEPNSTLQRLIRKLNLLDAVDEQSGSGKLDLIIQLPYVIKSEARRNQAEQRREDITSQLKDSKYGIAYTDGTEKITQLNRPAENNLLAQIEYLTKMLYGQLGLTDEIMNGTADEKAMINYFNRTIEPLIEAIIEAMQRTFLRKTIGIDGKERIRYFQNPFRLVPINDLANIADKFSRNEILTSNEIRAFMGLKPSADPKAELLMNSNMPQPVLPTAPEVIETEEVPFLDTSEDEAADAEEEEFDRQMDELGV